MQGDPDDLDRVLRRLLPRLRDATVQSGEVREALVRALTVFERERRVALEGLRGPLPDDEGTLDPEETREALRRRLDEYTGRCEGFVKALAILAGPDLAAEVDAAARRRLDED